MSDVVTFGGLSKAIALSISLLKKKCKVPVLSIAQSSSLHEIARNPYGGADVSGADRRERQDGSLL
jgi:hypothetical protein